MHTPSLPRSVAALLLTTLAAPTFALDWPQWRGPQRDGVSRETGLLKQWPAEGPKRVWLFDKAGAGYSGFAIVEGALYTMGTRDNREVLLALDAGTGAERWVAPIADVLQNNWGNGPRGTPAVDGDRIYALGGQGTLLCVSAKDGKLVWKRTMQELGGKVPGWGYTESVLIDGANVVCTPGGKDGTVAALDKMTGELRWQSKEWTSGAQYSSVVPAKITASRSMYSS